MQNLIEKMGADEADKVFSEIETRHPDWNGNDILIGTSEGRDIMLGFGGDDYIDGHGHYDIIHAGSGNDIVVLPGDWYGKMLMGGEGTDTLLSGSDSSKDLLQILGQSKSYARHGFEILFRATDTKDVRELHITSHDDLEDYGVFIGDGTLGLSDDWKSAEARDGLLAFTSEQKGHSLRIETILPEAKVTVGMNTSGENAVENTSSPVVTDIPDADIALESAMRDILDGQG